MNANHDLFTRGWRKTALRIESEKRPPLPQLELWPETVNSYRIQRDNILLSTSSLGFSTVQTITNHIPLQLNLFNDYVKSKDCRNT